MSANLDLVRSIYAAWEHGDYSSVEWAHPEIEFIIAEGPSPGRWTGVAGMTEGWTNWLGAWEDFRAEAEEYRVLDSERILVLVHNSGRGRTSGLAVDQHSVANLFQIRGGRVTRFVLYWDSDRALADLGLAG